MIEIEIDGPRCESLHFAPLQRRIRGRFDLNKMGEPMARVKAQQWPVPIPSQRLGIDEDGVGYLHEPLHDDENAPLREQIERRGKGLEPKLQRFEHIHHPSWLFWMKRAVESGIAKITKGSLPTTIEGKPRLDYILASPGPSAGDKLTKTLNEQTKAFNRLADAIEKLATKK
ncbi:MAG: hypothetical protein WED34_04805 [Planctomycetales bacterium]